VIIINEPGAALQATTIKLWTGDDLIVCRHLFSNDVIEYYPKFTPIVICNKIPEILDSDEAFERRSIHIKFEVQFIKEGEPITNANQRYRDETLQARMMRPEMRLAILRVLAHIYTESKGRYVNPPAAEVAQSSAQEWFTKTFEELPAKSERSTWIQYKDVRSSYDAEFPENERMNKVEFSQFLKEKVLKLKKTQGFKKHFNAVVIPYQKRSEKKRTAFTGIEAMFNKMALA
jgi:phage/plasmid-associated DNA primase